MVIRVVATTCYKCYSAAMRVISQRELRNDSARVLREAVTEVEGVWADPAPEVWVERFGESSIDLAVRFWHEPDNATMWRVRHGVVGSVKRRLDAAGIVMPFPQRTVSFLGAEEARAAGDRPGR